MSSEIHERAEVPAAAEEPQYGIRARGHHLPDATRIGRVRLQVADLARSVSWYEKVLGFRAIEWSEARAVLAAYGDDAPIVELHGGARARTSATTRLGLYHVAILLPDRASLGRFVAHLAALDVRAGAGDHFVSEALYLNDPDGLGIEVYADRPRSGWRVHGRELDIGTTALDVASLVRAGGPHPWTGMPAGTRIGHVHLSIGDLDLASRFYHEGLGFDVMTWSYPGALFVSAGGYHHHLGLNTWAGPRARAASDDEPRLLEWELLVPGVTDAEDAARSLEAAGHSVGRDGSGWSAADPWGTRVHVVAESHAPER